MTVRFIALLCLIPLVATADGTVWHTLRSPEAQASSYLQTNWNRFTENYHPTYVLDDNPATAWTEGVEGDGEGQVLTLPLSTVSSARAVRVRIRNGYQKSRGLLVANAAPEQIVLRLRDITGAVTAMQTATLERKMGWQEVTIAMNGAGFDRLELEVVTVHAGSRYRDTCISDVLVDVDSDQAYSAQAEEGRLQRASKWIAERVEAARYFASQPADYPFKLNGYTDEETPVDGAQAEQIFIGERRQMAEMQALPQWYDVSHVRRIEALDSMSQVRDILQYFVPANLAWFETDDAVGAHYEETLDDSDFKMGETSTHNDKVLWANEEHTQPARVLLHMFHVWYGRGVHSSESDYSLRYNDAGRLVAVYLRERQSGEEAEEARITERFISFTYDGQGTVSTYTRTERYDSPDWDQPAPVGDDARPRKVTYSRKVARAEG